jgi:hypothetical protein
MELSEGVVLHSIVKLDLCKAYIHAWRLTMGCAALLVGMWMGCRSSGLCIGAVKDGVSWAVVEQVNAGRVIAKTFCR